MRSLGVLAFVFALTLGSPRAQAQAPTTKSGDAGTASVANGKRAFVSAGCVACHGPKGEGTASGIQIAPPPLELPALISYVRQPTGKMPPFGTGVVSDQQLSDIYAFLESVAPPPSAAESLTGNSDNGKKLFAAYGCFECHGRQGAGASTGPRIGPPAISFAAVLRYVRAPSGQMPPYTAKVVSDQDLADIYTYLKSLAPPARAADIPLLNQ
ncbi:MAG TPA: c-type cytochrome [Candidatus Acidoferrales bacterium]